jgi:asparagine synthase (glutamine-hydrolysing)
MTGIAGIVLYSGHQSQLDQVHAMLEAMPHRGTSVKVIKPRPHVAIGICTDHAISKSLFAHQGSLSLVDGEIYSGLHEPSAPQETAISQDSIPANVLAAFRNRQHGLFENLVGEFAVTIWDDCHEELTFARDAFGTKPLYFHQSPQFFAFASEVKGLLALSSISSTLNRDRVADFILSSLEGIDTRSTFFKGIHRMAAGHYYRLSNRRLSSYRHWNPSASSSPEAHSIEYVEEFKRIFQTAVECRYRDPSHTGVLLSGGIDSCSIAAVAAASTEQNLNTFSLKVGLKNPTCEESASIDHFQSRNHFNTQNLLASDVVKTAPSIRTLASTIDNPFTASLIAGPIPLYAMAKTSGMQRVVDGVDGDVVSSLTGNYQWFVANELGLTAGCRELVKEALYFDEHRNLPRMLTSFVLRRLSNRLLPRNTPIRTFLRSLQTISARKRSIEESPIKSSFAKEVHLLDRYRQQFENEHPRYPVKIEEACSNTLAAPFLVAAIERYEEAASTYSLQATHPFMDVRLVNFCLNAPWHYRTRNGVPKWILRQAMAKQLPSKITNQYKIENIAYWFLDEINRNYLTKHPTPPNWLLETLEDFVKIELLRKEWKQAVSSPHSDIADIVSTSIVLGEWLRERF